MMIMMNSEISNKRYFRLVLDPALQFTDTGALAAGPRAVFHDMPEQPILVMHVSHRDGRLLDYSRVY